MPAVDPIFYGKMSKSPSVRTLASLTVGIVTFHIFSYSESEGKMFPFEKDGTSGKQGGKSHDTLCSNGQIFSRRIRF